jgi:hypothetical protein
MTPRNFGLNIELATEHVARHYANRPSFHKFNFKYYDLYRERDEANARKEQDNEDR